MAQWVTWAEGRRRLSIGGERGSGRKVRQGLSVGVAKTMGIRRMRGATRCARAYRSAQSRPRQGGTQDTAQRTEKKKRVCVRYRTETCAFQKK